MSIPIESIRDHSDDRSSRVSRSTAIQDAYARWALTYDQTPNPLLALEERYLAPMLPNLRGLHVLDLACGTARWMRMLDSRMSFGVGVDLSVEMLKVAERNSGNSTRLTQADCLNLPFADATFDLVICSFAIEHVDDLSRLSTEISRILKSSGHIFLTELHPSAYLSGWRNGFRDSQGQTQIDSIPHPAANIIFAFERRGFQSKEVLECFIGTPELPIFVKAGKEESFRQVSQIPAILLFHFSRDSRIDKNNCEASNNHA